MAPLIAPGICRYAVNGTYGGRNCATIIDMWIDPETVVGPDRDAAVIAQARDILHAFDDNILTPHISNQAVMQNVSWVDLDSETGSTGSVNTGGGDTWPRSSANTFQAMPGNVSALITKVAPGGGRRSRNGRIYMYGIAEATTALTDPSNLTGAAVSAFTASWETFSSDVSNTVVPDGYSSNMVVLHTHNEGTPTAPDIVYDGYSLVDSMVCQSRLATQRRRVRG